MLSRPKPAPQTRALMALFAFCVALASVYAQGGPASGSSAELPAPGPGNPDRQVSTDGGAGTGSSIGSTGAGAGSATSGGYGAQSERRQSAERKRFSDWFLSSAEGRRLALFRMDIEALAYASIEAGVPADAYKLRIKEAVAKGVEPAIVLAALREDANYWDAIGPLLVNKGWPPTAKAADFYVAAATALRNGLAFSAVRELLEWAAPARAQAERASAVLKAITLIASRIGADAGQAGQLALELMKSRLPVGQFDELAALANAAAERSVGPGDFTRALLKALRLTKPLEELARSLSL
jgi:hypothetical protein